MQHAISDLSTKVEATRVLIVDDDSSMLQLIRTVLQSGGYHCLTASSGKEALRLIDSTPGIVIVVSDIHMPGIDGIQFLRNLASHVTASCAPRVIFVTADPQLDFAVAALRLGATDFLTKPLRPQQLLSAVNSAVERVRRESAAAPLTDQVAAMVQQAEALAIALKGLTQSHSRAAPGISIVRKDSEAARAGGAAKPSGAPGPNQLALLGLDHVRCPRGSFAPLGKLDDIAWDLLRALLRAEKSAQRLSVSALSISVPHVSQTTALRRIQKLVKGGQIARNPDPTDARRDFVTLTPQSRASLEQYLEQYLGQYLEQVSRELTASQ